MRPRADAVRALYPVMVAMVVMATAGIIFLSGMPTPALAGEKETVEKAPQTIERGCGGCRCGQARVSEAGPGEEPSFRGRGLGMRQGRGHRQGYGSGQQMDGPMGRGGRRSHGSGSMHSGVMVTTRALVHDYRQDIVREIEDVENGVVTLTRAPGNPDAVAALQRHVSEMKALLESGGRVRVWDPLFAEIFDHSDEIEMAVEKLEDGVRVLETSKNPRVVELIRAHARKVSEFLERGPAAVHEPTALPDGYSATAFD